MTSELRAHRGRRRLADYPGTCSEVYSTVLPSRNGRIPLKTNSRRVRYPSQHREGNCKEIHAETH